MHPFARGSSALLTSFFIAISAMGCGSGGGGGSPVPIDVRGHWTGTWVSTSNPGTEGTLELDLLQQAVTVTGSSHLFGSPCISEFTNLDVDAQFDETTREISGSIGSIPFIGSVSSGSNRISGTYFGACGGDQGTVALRKATPLMASGGMKIFVFEDGELVQELQVVGGHR